MPFLFQPPCRTQTTRRTNGTTDLIVRCGRWRIIPARCRTADLEDQPIAAGSGRPTDERTTFLAHSEGGTNRFYEGDVDEDYLVELVNLIGKEYFDGEHVYVHSKTSGSKAAVPIPANA